MTKFIEQMEHCIEDLKNTMRDIKKEFDLTNPARTVYTLFIDNLFDKIVGEDIFSRKVDNIKEYLITMDELIDVILEKNYDLQKDNTKLKNKYEKIVDDYKELENKYKTMERNFYDAFS